MLVLNLTNFEARSGIIVVKPGLSLLLQTLLSLSKLALLASSEEEKNDKVRKLNEQLHHIEVQQSLPTEILEVGWSVRW